VGPREGARKATPSEENKIIFNFIHYFNPIIKLLSPARDFNLYLNKKKLPVDPAYLDSGRLPLVCRD
jgi:hypothetical protein